MSNRDEQAPLLAPALREWVERQLEGALIAVERIAGGASRQSYFLRLAPGAVAEQAVLRIEGGQGPMAGTHYNLEREAALLHALADGPVRVPALLGFNADLQAMLMSRAGGGVDYGAQTKTRRRAIEAQLIDQLARLHGLALDFAPICRGEPPRDITAAVRVELDYWQTLYHQRMPRPEPLLDFAFDWLRRHLPASTAPPALVHGDIGPGNFLFDDDGITALIDWELAHPGHPLEDLGALIARTLGTPFGDLDAHVRRYVERSGWPLADGELTYCVALALTRFCVGIGIAIAQATTITDMPVLVRFRQLNLHALGLLLARRDNVPASAAATLPVQTDETAALFSHAGDAIETLLLPGLAEPFLQYRARGLASLLRYLRALATPTAQHWREESQRQLAALLAQPVLDETEALLRFRQRLPAADPAWRRAALRWLLEDSARNHALMRDALAEMAGRTLDFEEPHA